MKKTVFTGAAVAIITPMDEQGAIVYPELARIIEDQIRNSTDAIVICGTTGEASALTDEEHIEEIRFAVEKAAGRVPVIAGTGSNDTAYAIHLTQEAERVGADATLQVTPYYNKTSQRGLIRHFNAIADSVKIPTILYNVPSRTGVNIQPETYLALSENPNIVAAKEACGNLSQIAKTIALCGDALDIYSGNDDQIVPILSLGGKGVISVLSNVAPKTAHDIVDLYLKGQVKESAALQLRYLELIDDLFCDVNPIPVKEAMNMLGYAAGPCRLPLCELSDANHEKLRACLAKYGLIRG